MQTLEKRFHLIFSRLGISALRTNKVARLWKDLSKRYQAEDRHYHTLEHLRQMLQELDRYPGTIQDIDALELAVFYHDAIYRPARRDNEARSAKYAQVALAELKLATSLVQKIQKHILATKDHLVPQRADPDLPLLLDADLAILGSDTEAYKKYYRAIRREYSMYPNLLFKPTRRKAMIGFIQRRQIYQTPHFRDLYEDKARRNIEYFEVRKK